MGSKKQRSKTQHYIIVKSGLQQEVDSDSSGELEAKYDFSDTGVENATFTGSREDITHIISKQSKASTEAKENKKDRKQDRKFRSIYAPKVFDLIKYWLFMVFFFLLMDGFTTNDFEVDDKVLIALVTGLSASIVSLLAIVLYWMFPRRDKKGSGS